jgi:hypothetical protein
MVFKHQRFIAHCIHCQASSNWGCEVAMECHWRMDDDGISFGMADGMIAKFERRVAAFY